MENGKIIRRARRKRRIKEHVYWTVKLFPQCLAAIEYERYYVRHEINLVDMPNEKLRVNFRVENYQEFCRLRDALRLPPVILCDNGSYMTADAALAVVLRCLAYPNRWVDCMDLLGRDRTQLSRVYNATVSEIFRQHGHLLENMNQSWLNRQRVENYASAVQRHCGYYCETSTYIRPRLAIQRSCFYRQLLGIYRRNCSSNLSS